MSLAEKNNNAAALIREGRYEEAYVELRVALEWQLTSLHEAAQNGNQFSSTGNRLVVLALVQLPPDSNDLLFSSPLVICSPVAQEFDADRLLCSCAAAIFNMGLACHRYGRESHLSPQQKEHCYLHAQALYQQARDVGAALVIAVLHLALCNNMLDLAFEMRDGDAACIWNFLFSQWMSVIPLDIPADIWIHFLKVQVYSACRLAAPT